MLDAKHLKTRLCKRFMNEKMHSIHLLGYTQWVLVSNTECKHNFWLVTRKLHREPLTDFLLACWGQCNQLETQDWYTDIHQSFYIWNKHPGNNESAETEPRHNVIFQWKHFKLRHTAKLNSNAQVLKSKQVVLSCLSSTYMKPETMTTPPEDMPLEGISVHLQVTQCVVKLHEMVNHCIHLRLFRLFTR